MQKTISSSRPSPSPSGARGPCQPTPHATPTVPRDALTYVRSPTLQRFFEKECYVLSFNKQIQKNTAKRLLSTNNEKWNTIPRTYSEIDTLREKFRREGQDEKLIILDEINVFIEEMEKLYSSV